MWEPSTPNPTLVRWKPHTSKNGQFSLHACGNGMDLPHGAKPNGPQCAKSHAVWQSLSSRTKKLRIFSKNVFFYFFRDVCGGLYCFSIKFGRNAFGWLLAHRGLLLELLGVLWLAKGNSGSSQRSNYIDKTPNQLHSGRYVIFFRSWFSEAR